ncbi:unnamed protein product [Phyllotreta striolata]|uniref:Uncharacterized protein n=1 Tax=Phyllotreta striolata TaxID=444603 RepID=A0A9N9TPT4_PHYSR|nr:unnamed protein product [Phyllotreta striolata]
MRSIQIVILSIFISTVRSMTLRERLATTMIECEDESKIESDELVAIYEGNVPYTKASLEFLYCFGWKMGFELTNANSQRLANIIEKLGLYKGDVAGYVNKCLKDIDNSFDGRENVYTMLSCLIADYYKEKLKLTKQENVPRDPREQALDEVDYLNK